MTSNHPVVFVPALFGSELVYKQTPEKKHSAVCYIDGSIGLNINCPDISLPLLWHHKDDGSKPVQETDDIVAGRVLEKIQLSCFCNVTLLDQYSAICHYYRKKKSDSPFYTFEYDWRRDLNETTDNLVKFVEEINCRHRNTPQVISHSMGCLITLCAMKTNPHLFHSLLLIGGNFGGGAGFYPTNTSGMKVGLNAKYLSGRVCHTFPSMYAAASPMGVGTDPILKDEEGDQLFQFVDCESLLRGHKEIVDIDMYNLEHWRRYKLGPWSLNEKVSSDMEQHVRICLELGKHFQQRMRSRENSKDIDLDFYPKVAVLVGDGHLKPDYFLWNSRKSQWVEWNKKLLKKYKPKKFVKTDGTVSYISASQPPLADGVTVQQYIARNNGKGLGSHRELMNDVEMIDKILNELNSN